VFSDAEAAYKSASPLITTGGILMIAGLPSNGMRVWVLDVARGTHRFRGDNTGILQRLPEAMDFIAKNGIKPDVEV
jgi:D-arabinose 1-dehydrogenase-like Zn-dependent alcohol dehydrogenase